MFVHASISQSPPAEEGRSLNGSLGEMLFRLRMSCCGHPYMNGHDGMQVPARPQGITEFAGVAVGVAPVADS